MEPLAKPCEILTEECRKREISSCIVVTDISHHVSDEKNVGWQDSTRHIAPEQVAENPSKVLMAGIGKKAARIRQHTDGLTEKADR